MKAYEISAVLEEFAPLSLQESWDNSGFCVGDPNLEVTGVYVALDCTLEVVEEAVAHGANMIVTHHPLIFGTQKNVLPGDKIGSVIIALIKANMVLYSTHTPIDKAVGGVSWGLARQLGLQNIQTLDVENIFNQGLGVIGELPVAMTYEQFIAYVKGKLGISQLRSSKPVTWLVKKIALCGGSGSSLMKLAASKGADCMVTGDVKYHDFYVGNDMPLIDVGHYESEINIVDTIFTLIQKNFPNFAICKITENKNLVYYY